MPIPRPKFSSSTLIDSEMYRSWRLLPRMVLAATSPWIPRSAARVPRVSVTVRLLVVSPVVSVISRPLPAELTEAMIPSPALLMASMTSLTDLGLTRLRPRR